VDFGFYNVNAYALSKRTTRKSALVLRLRAQLSCVNVLARSSGELFEMDPRQAWNRS
jgi:hypothetical protein